MSWWFGHLKCQLQLPKTLGTAKSSCFQGGLNGKKHASKMALCHPFLGTCVGRKKSSISLVQKLWSSIECLNLRKDV